MPVSVKPGGWRICSDSSAVRTHAVARHCREPYVERRQDAKQGRTGWTGSGAVILFILCIPVGRSPKGFQRECEQARAGTGHAGTGAWRIKRLLGCWMKWQTSWP